VQVPNVYRAPYASAKAQLQAAGFKVARAADQNSETVPAGAVMYTHPTGTQPYGSTVTLVVSKGPVFVAVPHVAGLGIDQACSRLTNLGLKCSAPSYSPGAKVKYSTPGEGKLVRLHTVVTLFF
jgi:serine/threonine-protein kinase